MRKLPKMGLITCLGLLLAAASCEKNATTPIQEDFVCTTDAEYKVQITNRDVVMITVDGKDWSMQADTNDVLYSKESLPRMKPCGKIPVEILKKGLVVTITGKATSRSTQSVRPAYEYFILENFKIKTK